jgi:drug/metabolite transporter (DMT)-like permease
MVLNTTVSVGLLFAGTAHTSLVSMSLISLFGPILTIFGGYFFLKDKISWIEKIGIGITFIGSLFIIIEPIVKSNGIQGELLGNILVIGSLVSGSIATILLKELLRKGVGAIMLANLGFVVGFVTMIPIVLHFHSTLEIADMISKMALSYHLGIIYLAVFSGTIAYTLNNLAQKTIEVSELAVFSYVYPIISAILAVWFLKEPMTPLGYFGSGITLVGIFIAEVKRRTRSKKLGIRN